MLSSKIARSQRACGRTRRIYHVLNLAVPSSISSCSSLSTSQPQRSYTSYKSITKFPLNVDHTTTDHNYIKFLAENLPELGPYPTYSKYVNPFHFYQNTVMSRWLTKKSHPVTLRQLANFGKKLTKDKVISSANFVRVEIAIRIAKKLKDLQVLPYAAVSNHHLVRVYESYYNIFETFRKIKPITTLEENDEFCKLLSKMLKDNLLSLPHLIMGALECSILGSMNPQQLDEFMSSTLRARISRRLLCEEHLSLTDNFELSNDDKVDSDYIGDVFFKCSAQENLRTCGEQIVKNFSESGLVPEGFLVPDLIIQGEDVKFQFMVTHLRYLFGEILRNSYESTINNFIYNNGDKPADFFKTNKPPPIVVTIVSNKETVNFRFSDQGGGIKGMTIDQLWSFAKGERISRQSLRNFHKLPGLQLANDYNPIDFADPEEYDTPSTSEKHGFGTKKAYVDGKRQTSTVHGPPGANSANAKDRPGAVNISAHTPDTHVQDALVSTSLGGHYHDTKYFKTDVKSSLQNLMERPSDFRLNLGLAMCKVYADYWNGNITMNTMENYGSDTYLTLQRLGTNDELRLDKA